MKAIRIVSVPPGQAPEWVREKWVGVEIPLPIQEEGGFEVGVLGGLPTNVGGYQVETRAAINAVREKSPKAAQWWEDNNLVRRCPRLVFARHVCEVIT